MGPVDVRVRETLPEVGRTTGAIGATVEDVSIFVDVVAAVETDICELVLLLGALVVDGKAVTVGLIVTIAVDAAAQPTPAHV